MTPVDKRHRVRLNDNVSTRYLIGQTRDIHEINDDYIVVCLDQPSDASKAVTSAAHQQTSNHYLRPP